MPKYFLAEIKYFTQILIVKRDGIVVTIINEQKKRTNTLNRKYLIQRRYSQQQ